MKKIIVGILTALAVLALVSGSVAAVTITDDLGRTVELPDEVTQVIPSGQLAQTVLLSFDQSYIASLFTDYDEDALKYLSDELANLPNTGTLYGSKKTMSDEEIIALAESSGISFVLDVGEVKSGIKEELDAIQTITSVPFVFVTQSTIDDIPVSYQKIGKLLGEEERGEEISTYTQSVIDRFNEGMAKVGDNKKTMLYVTKIDGNSVYILGSGNKSSFHTSVIDDVATNIAPEAIGGSGVGDAHSMEDILLLNPDVIIVNASGADSHEYYNTIMSDPAWATLSAVRNGNVYEAPVDVPMNWMGIPPSSLNKIVSMIWLGKLLYPDTFNYDMKSEIQNFYKVMLNYTLSDEDYAEMTQYSMGQAKQTASSPFPVLGIIAGIGAAVLFLRRH